MSRLPALPALPLCTAQIVGKPLWTERQMRAYARAAVALAQRVPMSVDEALAFSGKWRETNQNGVGLIRMLEAHYKIGAMP